MNQGGAHRAMNGFHQQPSASTSANSYPEYSSMQRNHQSYPNNMNMQHQQQPQQMQQMQQNQWQPPIPSMAMGPNHPVPSQQHPPHFNQQPWPNQMQHPAFGNGMPGMGPFNMPFLPPQVLQDAFAMSAPVEAADEMTLVTTLLSSRKKGETYKDALNSLHGKNGHASSLWKDYYLDHKDRLDTWITSLLKKEPNHAEERHRAPPLSNAPHRVMNNKPSPLNFKTEPLPVPLHHSSASAPVKRRKESAQPSQMGQPSGSRRSTINSLTTPAPVYGSRLPPPNSEIQIPEPPSRSPSPPTNIIPHRGRGNKYTKEDREFFINFVSWRLKLDSSLSRLDLCNLLAEKAPHHTSQSWASHWSSNHDIPDKILAAARGDEYDSQEDSDSEEEKIPPPRRRPQYRESSSESDEDAEGTKEEDKEDHDDDDDDGADDDGLLQHWDASEMGPKGGPFTDADLYITAQYIASFSNFEDAAAKDRWDPFHEKYPQRSAKSWTEYYRRNEREIDKLVRKIKNRRKSEQSTPSCAQASLIPPKAKRKHAFDGDETGEGMADRNKRGRGDTYT